MIRILVAIFIIFPLKFSAFAEEMTLVQIEAQLEQRLSALVHSYDSNAQVIVKASIKTEKSILPGTTVSEVDLYGSGLMRGVSFDEISSVDVSVLTSHEELPGWLRTELNKVVKFKNVQVKIQVVKIKELETPESRPNIWAQFLPKVESWGFKLLIFLGSAGLTFLLLMIIYLVQVPRVIESATKQLLAGFKETSQEKPSRTGTTASKEMEGESIPSNRLDFNSESQMPQLSPAGAKSIYTDCYWSEEDAYASWLWSKFEKAQKEELIKALPFAYSYSNYLSTVKPIAKNYHLHPYYLNPLNLEIISNPDFESWLLQQKNPPQLLSPIRSAHIHIPLENRLKWLEKSSASRPVSLPTPSAKLRDLPFRLGELTLTSEDEKFIIENQNAVPADCRGEVISWIWLWLLEPSIQEKMLSEYTSEDLASAWIGPENVMNDLMNRIPERKRKLLQELTQKITADRRSWVLADVTRVAVQQFKPQSSQGQAA